jgi:hypothetical protein
MKRRLGLLPSMAAIAALASTGAVFAILAPASPLTASCAAAGSNRAAIVIEHGDGTTVTRCVSFDTASVTGEVLLNSSGVAWSGQTFGGYGVAVCAMDAEPAHYTACPGKDSYWAVFVSRAGGAWQTADIGISTLTLASGDAEGFRYVPAVGMPEAPISPAGVCTSAAATGTGQAAGTAGAGAASGSAGTATGAATGAATAPSAAAAAGSGGVAASSGSVSEEGATASDLAGAGASAASSSGASAAGGHGDSSPSAPGSGLDPGLLAAAVVGGGLAGLAVLRLAASRRAAGNSDTGQPSA